ncbi:CHAP domain-containing protein [Candidatus Saccharibacteria bacterium]|nr:CHAP domain-containing protein [Candidatus Saccharibacteria bacterium]
MVILSTKQKKILTFVMVFFLFATPIFGGVMMVRSARGLSKACRNSEACMAAVAREQAANKNAAQAAATANLFQNKVYELNAEIAAKELQIAETEAEIDELTHEIKEAEKKLNAEQDALAELLINMHFESDSEPITILAGSSSISDLAEKQARNEVVKQQIGATAKTVKETKLQLEADKAKVEELLAQQKTAKIELEKTRAEQQALVIKYENDAAGYAAEAEIARAAQREAERAYQEAHKELFQGSSYTGDDTYPWQADCPAKQDYYTTYIEDGYGSRKIGGYVCECVSYAGWKAYEAYGLALAWGNAYSWDDGARAAGYRVDHVPEADSIGQVDGYPYGHVFWVENVNDDGSINVTEYNNSYATYLYSGVSQYGSFGSRRISAGEVWQYNFIHLK